MALLQNLISLVILTDGTVALAKAHGSITTKDHRITDFPKMASVSSSQAVKSAMNKVNGQLVSIGLETENGYLVYAVEIVNPKTGLHEVNIDAGTAKIVSDHRKDRADSTLTKEHD
ncbi:MAG: PepSY domain-containing protein [Bdellovibrio sp.]|nr:PepSY domain-containing protein [Bdellovibrio sp.]